MTATAEITLSAGTQPKPRKRLDLVPYLFILPHLVFFAVFLLWPFVLGLGISLFEYDVLRPEATKFVGLGNYVQLFTQGTVEYTVFWNALINTIEFVVLSVPPLILVPFGMALLLNTKLRGRNFFRAIYFAPWVLSSAVVGLLGFWIFQSQGGLVNSYLKVLGIEQPRWLSTMPWAWYAIVLTTVWWTSGFNMVILLAALQSIPAELYEAASIDGASAWQRFTHITVPQLRPILLFIVIITIIASFNLFAQPFLMTRGGPAEAGGGGATEPIMMRIYNEGFTRNRMGSSAAMSFVVAAIMVFVSYLNFRLFRERE